MIGHVITLVGSSASQAHINRPLSSKVSLLLFSARCQGALRVAAVLWTVAAFPEPVGASAPLGDTFNLECSGFETRKPLPDAKFQVDLRIDLSSRRWCDGVCASTNDIIKTTPTQIVLEDGSDKVLPIGHTYATLSRDNGRYVRVRQLPPPLVNIAVAECVRKPFSGMPRLRF